MVWLLGALVLAACGSSSTGNKGGSGGGAGTAGASGGPAGAGGSDSGTTGGAGGGASGAPTSDASAPLIPAQCWPGPADCNPVTNTGCPTGMQCGFNGTKFLCVAEMLQAPGPGKECTIPGNHCQPGLICDQGPTPVRCSKPCCVKSDCASTDNCKPLPSGGGTMGFCGPP